MNNTLEPQTQKQRLSRGDVVDALNQNNYMVVKVTFLKGNLGGTADNASIRPKFWD
jgi:hypothetical protein